MGLRILTLFLLAGTSPLAAQSAPPPADQPPPRAPAPAPASAASPAEGEEDAPAESAPAPPAPGGQEVIVTGQRLRGEVAGNVEPEVRLNEDQIRAYGATSIGALVDALAPQTRSGRGRQDGPPIVLLNGQRIAGFGEIRDLPPEAVERVDILPEEVALRYGYRADQRVVNIVLKENFRALTLSHSATVPTAGGRASYDGQANLLRIDRAGRWSIDGQYQRSTALLESERDLIQSAPALPYDLIGNVGASPFAPGAEIDPALSAAAGVPVTVAAVPASAATGAPVLGDFVPGANRPNSTDLGRFRTLLPETEVLTLNATINRRLGRISATLNARFNANSSESRLGLPSLALTLPETNPFSPFSDDVTLFRYADAAGPLLRRTRGRTGHGGLTLDSNIGDWRWTFTSNYDLSRSVTRTDTNADPAAIQARLAAGEPSLNPFAPIGAGLLALAPEDRSESITRSGDAQIVFNGSPLRLPAGPVTTSLTLAGNMLDLESETLRAGTTQLRDLGRDRVAVLGNVDLPITSRREGVLDAVGTISLSFNFELEHLSDFGTLRTLGYGIRWEPVAPLDFAVNVTQEDGAPSIQQLGDPVLVTPNARVFDFVRGETVDVTRIDGGNPALVADDRQVLGVRATLRLLGEGRAPRPEPSTCRSRPITTAPASPTPSPASRSRRRRSRPPFRDASCAAPTAGWCSSTPGRSISPGPTARSCAGASTCSSNSRRRAAPRARAAPALRAQPDLDPAKAAPAPGRRAPGAAGPERAGLADPAGREAAAVPAAADADRAAPAFSAAAGAAACSSRSSTPGASPTRS